ncbi:3-keto-5-aminohexanoate cleavage protein [Vulgatibacter sp.]|uniref:3-keto-5-aminohexanoate cleavage protein n=1 Tax=Vulgatibacter sp. TaxID=1971226 RepID=UPI003567E1F3
MEKVIVTCALTGALANRDQCPAVPYTPEEIAEEARRAYEAGAAVVHIHAREDDGSPSWSVDVFRRIKEEVNRRCPVVVNFSTGGMGPMTERVDHIRQVKPEMGALNMGSMNYAKYSPKRKDFVFELIFANPFSDITAYLAAMKEANVKPEMECFDLGHVTSAAPLLDMGLLVPPLQFSFIVGVLGGIDASPENLMRMRDSIPSGSHWEVIGISKGQWRMIAAALTLGGNIRVGLEDNFYLDAAGKQMARSNGELVEKAVRMARDVGREPCTPDEARAILGLRDPWGLGPRDP